MVVVEETLKWAGTYAGIKLCRHDLSLPVKDELVLLIVPDFYKYAVRIFDVDTCGIKS